MRVVITGGTGLIGRRLAAALVARGDSVVVTSRGPERVESLPAGVEIAGWDGASAAELAPTIEGADAVVHLVGESIAGGRWTAVRKRRIEQSRTRSTEALVAALGAVERRPGILLQGSAVGYYGARGDEALTEASPPGAGFLADVCRAWEAAGEPAAALGVRRVLLRTGVVLAREGGALPKMALPFRLFAGGPVGDGKQWVPWIHLDDEVGAICFLLDQPTALGPFNLAAPGGVTNRALSRAIGRALHRPSLLPAPAFAMKLALGEMAELLLASQRVEPAALLKAGYSFRQPAIQPALVDLLG
jgi:uncharacterized protein (TIGR01777 family)